jgi:release factor glutamine methyltransferase
MTLRNLLKKLKNDIDPLDADLIIQHVLKLNKAQIYSNLEKEIDHQDQDLINKMSKSRLRGEPLAYLTGHKGFWKNDFLVTKDVLVPRPETEILVEAILEENLYGKTILELGTGSGVISISIADEVKNCTIYATDISIRSLLIAKKNTKKINLDNIIFLNHDWNNEWLFPNVDFIISNPPYIDKKETSGSEEGIWFEPEDALFSKKDGLYDIEVILKKSKNILNKNGKIFIEHAPCQKEEIKKIGTSNKYKNISNLIDLNGDVRASIFKC